MDCLQVRGQQKRFDLLPVEKSVIIRPMFPVPYSIIFHFINLLFTLTFPHFPHKGMVVLL